MRSSKRRGQSAGFVRSVALFGLLIGPVGAVASCGSGGSTGEPLGEESLSQITCAGTSTGGTLGRGGSIALGGTSTKGGTGGAGVCPADDCTVSVCKSGTCALQATKEPGESCVDAATSDRGRCANFDANGDRRYDYTVCCTGCLDSRLECVEFGTQTDAACGNSGRDCNDCGECSTCSSTGTCAAASGSCTGGQCLAGTCCTGCISGSTCFVNAAANCGSSGSACVNCDDGKSCTTDSCTNGSCQHANVTGGCNDGNQCTVNDSCSGSTCTGTAKDCNDQNVCTTDGCNEQDGCTHTPVAGSCNDGNACTNPDSCSNGTCTGAMVNCDDGNPCTVDGCNPMSGCQHMVRPEGAMCANNTACSTDFQCKDHDMNPDTPRVCRPQSGLNCEDGNPCTSDAPDCTTNPASCPHAPVMGSCGTGDLCRVGQTCSNGTCGGGTMINCNDDNPCTTDGCDPDTGCTHVPGNNDGECSDGNPCTTDDACSAGECVGEPVECVAIDDCHDVGTCDADTGTCDDPRKANGAECGRTGTCQSGRCTGDGVVEPTGGTGSGTAGGGPGGNDTGGTGTSGSAGEGTGDTGGSSGSSNGGSGNASGSGNAGDPYGDTPLLERNPGGCACRLEPSSPLGRDYAALAAATALAFVARRRRRAA
jgi:MYXO-CTERM domain-containing protein